MSLSENPPGLKTGAYPLPKEAFQLSGAKDLITFTLFPAACRELQQGVTVYFQTEKQWPAAPGT